MRPQTRGGMQQPQRRLEHVVVTNVGARALCCCVGGLPLLRQFKVLPQALA